ncbi:hypothetical protein [Paenibacillus radicis (ex Gao et al. 2016)]|uniref:Uncharacterized protein n=1 Tax=Paenibacillus radicis (ex Gao et al. 2016) TaxID=1737354 RepID=A0A917GYC6_9BACL|nr:hypothetical protein [Paenibacillus radicis (ex Gao et al. 2016)]GGG61562.1 hypothetical protein GCM10010918_13860 [Paenibacillus radicis (ex Gao et al. 2016)]
MSRAFYRMSWGLLLTIVDIRLGFFDILPDFIGYCMIWSGIQALENYESAYRKAKPFAILLTIASLSELLPFWSGSTIQLTANEVVFSLPSLIYSGAMMLSLLLMLDSLLSVLHRHAFQEGYVEFAGSVRGRRQFFTSVSAVTLIVFPFSMNASTDVLLAMIPLTLLGMLALIIVFFTLRKAGKTWGYTGNHENNPMLVEERDTHAQAENEEIVAEDESVEASFASQNEGNDKT